ncbi:MAG: hypothetical protein RLZZ241_476 [Bacteroidota bacterium]|jgi:formate--tetrahydrofolate ligase
MTDLEISQNVIPLPIAQVAAKLNLETDILEFYGKDKAKLPLHIINQDRLIQSNLILVTAITPTPAGEGKTTTSIGLGDGLNKIGKRAITVIREPSLGPVFGIKGGAAGGGWSQVIPMVDINLHFTGDFSAIEKANNLLAALIDNNIQSKTENLGIDPRSVVWKRCIDMNDRSLRDIISGLGGKAGGFPRETGFNITAASEVMAILCLSENFEDLKTKLGNIYIGDTHEGKPVYARDLKAEGAMAVLLKDAIKPNLVQSLEGNPALIHGGPFANIAQGTNSVIATKMGMSLADYVVTEAGFGSDLGAEKFMNIKCRYAGISPKAVVLVATIRALKYHGGKPLNQLEEEDLTALKAGIPNLDRHLESLKSFGIPVVVAINSFPKDTEAERRLLINYCTEKGVSIAVNEGWAKGSNGCKGLAKLVVNAVNTCHKNFSPTYLLEDGPELKIEKICKTIYGAKGVVFSSKAKIQLRKIATLELEYLPVCIAKTQKSLSDDEKLLGQPENFDIHIREFEIAAGAGFIIPIAGNMLRMPGLPGQPASEKIDIDINGNITGLF